MQPLWIFFGLLAVAPPEQDHGQAVAQLQTAVDNSTGGDRKAAIEALEAAIALQGQYPDQASASVPELALQARVILVRLYLADKNPQAAEKAMDDLIRAEGEQTAPVRSFGPEVAKLYDSRKAALQGAGTATLTVECAVECVVVVNERQAAPVNENLILGQYRIWVKAVDPAATWEYHEVELSEAGVTVPYTWRPPVPETKDIPVAPPPKPDRILPRGAEIAGMVVGVGMVIAGAVMLTFDGKCTNTGEPASAPGTTAEECGEVRETTPGGASLVGVGAGLLVITGVLLSVDEVRLGRYKGQQVMLGVRLRF
jgi:hypothetical protein